MGVYALHVSMLRGEITPLMHGRVDTELYQTGVAEAKNFVAMKYGGMTRAPGFQTLGDLRVTDGNVRWVPFVFNKAQRYALEFTPGYVRFWTELGQVLDGGSPYEIATPFTAADLPKLQTWQSGDVVYITSGGAHRVKKLVRSGETDWALEDYVPKDGPYLEINDTATSLTPAGTGHAVPKMTSNTAPSGDAEGIGTDTFRVFNQIPFEAVREDRTGTITYTYDAPEKRVVDGYSLSSKDVALTQLPSTWTFEGFDGTDWIVLDQRSGENDFKPSETRRYKVNNDTAYEAYKFDWVANGGSDTDRSRISRLDLHEKASEQTPFSVVASGTDGINGGAGFSANDIGRPIRIRGGNGLWNWLEITGYVSTTEVECVSHDFTLHSTASTLLWRLGAWGDAPGWPMTIGSYENRIAFGGTEEAPFDVWLTKSAGYNDMGVSDPLVADDAVTARPNPTGTGLNPVTWLLGQTDLIMGTEGALKALGARNANEPFGPENVRQLASNTTSTASLPGIAIGAVILFLSSYGRRLYEAFYSSEADGYVATELSVLNEHLFRAGVTSYAFQNEPHSVLWCCTAAGELLAVTYDRDQKAFGVTSRTVGGTVHSVTALPGDEYDNVIIAVTRTIDGASVSTAEVMAPFYRSDEHDYPVYFDAAVVATVGATVSGELQGLSHLEGETVGVWINGVDEGDFVVAAGAIAVGAAHDGLTAVVGLRIASRLVTLPVTNWGQRDGGTPGRQTRVVDGYLSVFETTGLSYGTEAGPGTLWVPEVPYDGAPVLETDKLHIGTLDDQWRNHGVIALETSLGYPATIRNISVHVEGA